MGPRKARKKRSDAARKTESTERTAAIGKLAAARAGHTTSPGDTDEDEDPLARRRSKLIESSASEASLRSESSDEKDSDDLQMRFDLARANRKSLGRAQKGYRNPRKVAHANETKKFIMFRDGRACQDTEKHDEYSESDLDDFLAPDDEVYGEESSSEDSEGVMLVPEEEEEGEGKKAPKRARRMVDSESESASASDSTIGSGGDIKKKITSKKASNGLKEKKKLEKLNRHVESSSEEEWDLAGPSGEIQKGTDTGRNLRERKSLRDQHGGLSPLERIRRAQRRTLGIVEGGGAEEESGEKESAEIDQEAIDLVNDTVIAGKKKRKQAQEERTKRKEKEHKAEPPPRLIAFPQSQHRPPQSPTDTESTSTRSKTASEASTATHSASESPTSSSSPSSPSSPTSSSSFASDGTVSDDSLDSEQRGQIRELMRKEAREMGHMGEEEAFRAYMELLFCSSIDPTYWDQVKSSEAHRMHYTTAMEKTEYLIISAQQYASSQAWVNCNPLLLEAVEQYGRFEIHKRTSKCMNQEDPRLIHEDDSAPDANCAACNKWGGHQADTMLTVKFLGRRHENAIVCPGESKLGEGMRLSHQYLIASPVYQRNRGLWGNGGDSECAEVAAKQTKRKKPPREFFLGYVCCRRITMFHALLHFRRHCLIFLTRRAKHVVHSQGHLTMDELLDRVLSDDAHHLMYNCFKNMLEIARTMQLRTGGEAQYALSRHGAFKTVAPQEVLLRDDGTDVSSLHDWRDGDGNDDSEVSS